MSGAEGTHHVISRDYAREIVSQLQQLTDHVRRQNERVGRMETLTDAHETALEDLDTRLIDLAQRFDAIPQTTAALVRKEVRDELKDARNKQDAERYRQLKAVGWRIIGGVVGSSAFIGWILAGGPLP